MGKYLTTEEIEKMNKMPFDEFRAYMKEKYPVTQETKDFVKKEVMRLKYYKIHDLNIIGKKEQGISYIYTAGNWEVDNDNIISDRIMGYDGDSIGSSTVFDIDEITEDEAMELINNM